MIQWVYEGASALFEHLVVATDDERIHQAVEKFGGKVFMTSNGHKSGTERCAEAAHLYEKLTSRRFSYVVNIQGDEPLIQPEQLQTLISCMQTPGTAIATLIKPMKDKKDLENPHVVKVVVDRSFRALYFSRAPIPFERNPGSDSEPGRAPFYTHVGLYAFRRDILEQIVKLSPSSLEQTESLEQLRWMEHGINIRTAVTHLSSHGVDTPEDLDVIRNQGSF